MNNSTSNQNKLDQRANLKKNALMWWFCVRSQQKVIITKKHYPNKRYYMLNTHEITYLYVTDHRSTYTEDKLRENQSHIKLAKLTA